MSGAPDGGGRSRVPDAWLARLAEETIVGFARRVDDQAAQVLIP